MKFSLQAVRLTIKQKILEFSKQNQDLDVEAVPTTDSKDAASRRLGAHSWMVELANEWLMELGNTTV